MTNDRITISADLGLELLSLLASMSGAILGFSNVVTALKPEMTALAERADKAASQLRPQIAETIGASMMQGKTQ